MSEIVEKVRTYIVDNFLFGDAAGLEENTSFLEVGIINSTGVLELILFLEETFDITVADDEVIPENLDSLRRVEAFIERKTT